MTAIPGLTIMIPALETELLPKTYECGPRGRMRLHNLMKHMQEIASAHAMKMGLGMDWMMKNGFIWVLVDMRMGFSDMPKWNRSCTLYTMPSGFDEMRAYREFIITDENDEEIVKATSVWMVLDLKNKRPVHTDKLGFDFPKTTKKNFETIKRGPLPENPGRIHTVRIGESSIDLNGHVNNTEYPRWAMDALSLSGEKGYPTKDILMSFRAEVFEGDVIEIHKSENRTLILKKEGASRPVFTMEFRENNNYIRG